MKKDDAYFNYMAAGGLRLFSGISALASGIALAFCLVRFHYQTESLIAQVLLWVWWLGCMFINFTAVFCRKVTVPYLSILMICLIFFILICDIATDGSWQTWKMGTGYILVAALMMYPMAEPVLHHGYKRRLKEMEKVKAETSA